MGDLNGSLHSVRVGDGSVDAVVAVVIGVDYSVGCLDSGSDSVAVLKAG